MAFLLGFSFIFLCLGTRAILVHDNQFASPLLCHFFWNGERERERAWGGKQKFVSFNNRNWRSVMFLSLWVNEKSRHQLVFVLQSNPALPRHAWAQLLSRACLELGRSGASSTPAWKRPVSNFDCILYNGAFNLNLVSELAPLHRESVACRGRGPEAGYRALNE